MIPVENILRYSGWMKKDETPEVDNDKPIIDTIILNGSFLMKQ